MRDLHKQECYANLFETMPIGVGLPESVDPNDPNGFGFTLVQLLSEQLDGRVEIDRKGGTEFRIFIPGIHKSRL